MDLDWRIVEQVKGFLDREEGIGLYEYARMAAKSGPCLEIGSYCGKSALFLAKGCQQGGTVLFSVDHHRGSEEQQPGEAYFDPELLDAETGRIDTFPHFRDTIDRAGLSETVVPIVCRSEVAARAWATPLGLVFIDGGHAYETVWTDYTAWAPHLLAGGFLLFHDIFPDPKKGGQAPYRVYQQALATGMFHERPMIRTLGVLQRAGAHRL